MVRLSPWWGAVRGRAQGSWDVPTYVPTLVSPAFSFGILDKGEKGGPAASDGRRCPPTSILCS